jgi:hypothetical protein
MEKIDPVDLKKLFEALDAHPVKFGGERPLEAHLVEGNIVELRTTAGHPVLAMTLADYESLQKMDPDDFQIMRDIAYAE